MSTSKNTRQVLIKGELLEKLNLCSCFRWSWQQTDLDRKKAVVDLIIRLLDSIQR